MSHDYSEDTLLYISPIEDMDSSTVVMAHPAGDHVRVTVIGRVSLAFEFDPAEARRFADDITWCANQIETGEV